MLVEKGFICERWWWSKILPPVLGRVGAGAAAEVVAARHRGAADTVATRAPRRNSALETMLTERGREQNLSRL